MLVSMEMWQLALLILLALVLGFFAGVLCDVFSKQLKEKLDYKIERIIYEDEDEERGAEMKNDCKFYDKDLDGCKLFSDWTNPMPILQPCVEGACSKYRPSEKGGAE